MSKYADDYIKRLEERLSPETISAVMNSDKIYFNEGVDACIEELRNEFIETFGYADDEHGLFDDIKKRFEQLKKPLQ